MRYYTAIGIKKDTKDGCFNVVLDGEEKTLIEMESFIWVSMLWVFLEEQNIFMRMKRMLELTFHEMAEEKIDKEKFLFCLKRLHTRGLIICGDGETLEVAVNNVMKQAIVIPSYISMQRRFHMFQESVSRGRSIRFSLRAFFSLHLRKEEKKLLHKFRTYTEVSEYLANIRRGVAAIPYLSVEGIDELSENMEKEFLAEVVYLFREKLLTIKAVKGGI